MVSSIVFAHDVSSARIKKQPMSPPHLKIEAEITALETDLIEKISAAKSYHLPSEQISDKQEGRPVARYAKRGGRGSVSSEKRSGKSKSLVLPNQLLK